MVAQRSVRTEEIMGLRYTPLERLKSQDRNLSIRNLMRMAELPPVRLFTLILQGPWMPRQLRLWVILRTAGTGHGVRLVARVEGPFTFWGLLQLHLSRFYLIRVITFTVVRYLFKVVESLQLPPVLSNLTRRVKGVLYMCRALDH